MTDEASSSKSHLNFEDDQNGTGSGSTDATVSEPNPGLYLPKLQTPKWKKLFKSVVSELDDFEKNSYS